MERTMSKHHVTASRLATPVVAIAIAVLAAGLVTFRATPHAAAFAPDQASARIDPYALQLTIKSLPAQETGDLF
jgi:hypothetical protein